MPETPSTQTPTPSATTAPEAAPAKIDLRPIAANLLQKADGDANRVIARLLKENYKGREELRGLQSKLPPEGAVVLAGEDAKRWEGYRALGDDPKAIGTLLETGKDAITRWETQERDQSYAKAAEVAGYNPALFKLLASNDKLSVTVKEEKDQSGKTAHKAYARDGNKEVPLDQYAKDRWGEHLTLLGGKEARRPAGSPPRPNDTPPAPQPGSSSFPDPVAYLAANPRYRSL